MVPLKELNEHLKFEELGAVDAKVDHADMVLQRRPSGSGTTHYHIVLWHVPKADEAAVAK